MAVLIYILLGLAGVGMVYLLHKQPKLALPALIVAGAVAGAVLLLAR